MPTYIVEQYELHCTRYRVEAKDRGEAIRKVFDGDGEEVGGTLYIDTDDTRGMPLNHLTKSECRTLELDEMSDFVPSIRSVEPEEAC